jgi:hypothetical protein
MLIYTSVADPGSGAFLPLGSGIRDAFIRDPVLFYPPDPGSGSRMEQWSDPGSGIKQPGSATLTTLMSCRCLIGYPYRYELWTGTYQTSFCSCLQNNKRQQMLTMCQWRSSFFLISLCRKISTLCTVQFVKYRYIIVEVILLPIHKLWNLVTNRMYYYGNQFINIWGKKVSTQILHGFIFKKRRDPKFNPHFNLDYFLPVLRTGTGTQVEKFFNCPCLWKQNVIRFHLIFKLEIVFKLR